jgi:hypothetical protein
MVYLRSYPPIDRDGKWENPRKRQVTVILAKILRGYLSNAN